LPAPLPQGPEPIGRRVFDALREAIVTLRLKPGAALSEKDIAARFGVSRQPVREAFIKLAEAGLVRVLPQRGTYVVKISLGAVLEARFIREAVEVAVVRRAAESGEPAVLALLAANIAEQEQAAAAAAQERFLALDDALHRGLTEAIGCAGAWQVLENVKAQMDRVRFLSLPDATPMPLLIEQHRAILAAIARREPDAAERAMRAHLGEILRSLPALARRFPELFEAEAGEGTAAARPQPAPAEAG
jgi:DNA-binding GntR family transcriptional regulator